MVAPTELPSDPEADEPCTVVPLRSVSCCLVLGSGSEPSPPATRLRSGRGLVLGWGVLGARTR